MDGRKLGSNGTTDGRLHFGQVCACVMKAEQSRRKNCRSGEEQSHKSPTPGDGPYEYRRAVKSILIYLENTSGI